MYTLARVNESTICLTGDTIRLVPLALEHLEGLCAVGLDPTIWALTTLRITNRDEMRDYVELALRDQHAGHTVPFVTMLTATDQIVGATRFANIVPEHRRAEIGWTWIAPPWQRTRVNTEAKYLMLRHAFETWKLLRVEFKTSSLNLRSREAGVADRGDRFEDARDRHVRRERARRLPDRGRQPAQSVEQLRLVPGRELDHMVQPDGSRRDSVYFSIIADEWPQVRARLEARLRSV